MTTTKTKKKAQANKGKMTTTQKETLYPDSPLEIATNAFRARVKPNDEQREYVADFLSLIETRIIPATRSFTFLDLFHASRGQGREMPAHVLRSLLSTWADTMQRLNKLTVLPPLVYDYETYVLI